MSDRNRERHSSAAVRGLAQVITLASPRPGFIGEGHTAIHVIDVRDFAHNDPGKDGARNGVRRRAAGCADRHARPVRRPSRP